MATAVTHSVGGKGANVAVAAARAGASVALVSAVGGDGERAMLELRSAGVDVSHVAVLPELATAEVVIHLAADQSEFGITVPGADRHVTLKAMDDAISTFSGGHIGYLDGMVNDGGYVIRAMSQRGAPLVVNPSPVHPDVAQWPMELATIIMLNSGEARTLTGHDDEHSQLDALHLRYPGPAIILTLGPRGAWWSHRGEKEFIPTVQVSAIDSTAAGDTFAGYFLAAIASGIGSVDALKLASRAAAICVTRHGSMHSIPLRAEVMRAG